MYFIALPSSIHVINIRDNLLKPDNISEDKPIHIISYLSLGIEPRGCQWPPPPPGGWVGNLPDKRSKCLSERERERAREREAMCLVRGKTIV